MIDAKLRSKLAPILSLDEVREVHLVRRNNYADAKVVCHTPPAWCRHIKPVEEFWRCWRIVKLCRRRGQDVALALGIVPNGWYVTLAGWLAGVPVIAHTMGKNDFQVPLLGRLGQELSLWSVRRAARVAVRGSSAIDWLARRGVPPERIFIQHNLHDFALFAPDASVPKDFDLIYVGLLARYKRLDALLTAFALVRRERPATTLLLVGDGPERERLQDLTRRLGINKQVEFAGRVAFESLPHRLNSARIFVMTSDGEGLPQAMIEALSCGLPVVMPRDADITDVARHEVNGLLYPVGDATACAEALLRILGDDALYQRLAAGALGLRAEHAFDYSLIGQVQNWRAQLHAAIN